jgi:hypothetical protein
MPERRPRRKIWSKQWARNATSTCTVHYPQCRCRGASPRAHLTLGKRGFAASVSASTVEGPTNRRKPPRRYIHPLSCLGLQDLDMALLPKGVV